MTVVYSDTRQKQEEGERLHCVDLIENGLHRLIFEYLFQDWWKELGGVAFMKEVCY